MTANNDRREWELPHLREAHQMPGVNGDFWSIKFYPYTEPGVDPIFAIVGGKHILVCRPPTGKDTKSVEIIRLWIDEESEPEDQPGTNHFACAWSKDLNTGDPLLCVSGSTAKIKIINIWTGECRVLTGHGGEINDLVVHPTNPYILASCSDDCTARIWSLDPAHESRPCVAILEGEGHKETILTLSFHQSGRYILTGGIDHVINLWTLPEFPDINTGTNRPTRIFYPHFSTSEIHNDIVDCVAWHNDVIVSKAANDKSIVLWSINGFDPSLPPPSPSTAPTTHDLARDTRSAFFSSTTSTDLYTRHLEFEIPDSQIIFMRFSLFSGYPTLPQTSTSTSTSTSTDPGSSFSSTSTNSSKTPPSAKHPILAFCNEASKVFFWDLTRVENYVDTRAEHHISSPDLPFEPPSKHPFLQPFQRRNRGGGAIGRIARDRERSTESLSSQVTGSDGPDSSYRESGESQEGKKERERDGRGTGKIDWDRSRKLWTDRYDSGEPSQPLQAHSTEVVKGLAFTGRQVGWSMDGKWCVVVGSGGVIACFQRWKE